MTEPTSDELIIRSRQGDLDAQQQLLMHYRGRLRRMVASYLDPQVTPRIDPSDVLQEAITIAAVRLPGYLKERPIAFYPWIRQIVREQLIVIHRRHVQAARRSVRMEQPIDLCISDASAMQFADRLVSQDTSPTQRVTSNELCARVRNALLKLPAADREILLMRFVEQLKVVEIAEASCLPEANVKSKLARALQKLNQLVGQP